MILTTNKIIRLYLILTYVIEIIEKQYVQFIKFKIFKQNFVDLNGIFYISRFLNF